MQLLLAHSLTAQMTDTFHHALSGLNINNCYKSICLMWSYNIIDTLYYCASPGPPNNFKKQAPCTVYSTVYLYTLFPCLSPVDPHLYP